MNADRVTAAPRAGAGPTSIVLAGLVILVTTGFWRGESAINVSEPAPTGAARIVSETTQPPPVDDRTPAQPVVVADPRPGDLRTDAGADVLPLDYTAPAAATTVRDLPYGPAAAQRLDLHLPGNTAAPVLLYLHSGGWIGGDKSAVPDMVMRFIQRGYAVASVEYHLAPEHPFPAPVTDVKLAIRWLKARAQQDGLLDGDRIVLVGASAGGHLAAFAAATPGLFEPPELPAELAAFDTRVAGVVSFVGPTDLVQLYDQRHAWARGIASAFAGCLPCDTASLEIASVAGYLHDEVPPAYWAYGAEDTLVDVDSQAVAISEAWASAGGESSSWLDVVDGADHTIDESMINQRALEAFVDAAAG